MLVYMLLYVVIEISGTTATQSYGRPKAMCVVIPKYFSMIILNWVGTLTNGLDNDLLVLSVHDYIRI